LKDCLKAVGSSVHNQQQSGPFTIAGNYAFSFAGFSGLTAKDNFEGPTVATGQFTADGLGHIESGTIDLGSLGSGQLTGGYSNLDPDGRGSATISAQIGSSPVTFNLTFYVTSSSKITLVGANADVLGTARQQ
jgi:hypothetical protein